MTCPKCGLTITAQAKRCPRCLAVIPLQNQGPPPQYPPNAGNQQQAGAGYRPQSQNTGSAPQYTSYQGQQGNPASGSPVYWVLQVFKKYADFSGRARRSEYWWFFLFQCAVSLALTLIGDFNLWYILLALAAGETYMLAHMGIWFAILIIFNLVILVPSLAVSVRRLHDTNRNGAYILLNLIPVIGSIFFIVYMAQDSNPGDNKYGPNPKIAAPASGP